MRQEEYKKSKKNNKNNKLEGKSLQRVLVKFRKQKFKCFDWTKAQNRMGRHLYYLK